MLHLLRLGPAQYAVGPENEEAQQQLNATKSLYVDGKKRATRISTAPE
jgi:hypothetical protein